MNITSYFKKNYLNLLFLLLAVVMAGLFISIGRYALPRTDDFSNLWRGKDFFDKCGDASVAAFQSMVDGYLSQQGTFFSGFSATFLLLKVGTDLVKYRHVTMIFTCFFFFAYIFSLRILAKYFKFDAIWGMFLFGALWVGMDRIGPGESLMFITGICVYGLPIALSLMSVSFYTLVMTRTKLWQKILCTLLASGCAFCACGGVLMVAAMTNMLMVLVFIHQWFTTRQFPFRGIIPFLFAFGSALANALAPGNFNRYSNSVGDTAATPHAGAALVNSIGITIEQIASIFTSTYVLIAFVAIALCILLSKRESEDNYHIHPVFFFLCTFVLAYIVIFPAALGYDMVPHGYIQERTVFTITQAITLGLFISWTYLWFWIKTNVAFTKTSCKRFALVACIVLVISVTANILYVPFVRSGESKPTITEICVEYATREIDKSYAAYYLATLLAIHTRPDTACYIYYEFPHSPLFPEESLSSDPQWWVNLSLSKIYDIPFFAYTPDHKFSEKDAEEYDTTIADLQP